MSTLETGIGDSSPQANKVADTAAAAQKVYSNTMAVGLEQARQTYEQAQQAYSQEVQSLYAELAERSQQAYKAYGESQNAAYTSASTYEACVAEYRGYLERLQQLFGGGEMRQRAQAAYDAYLARMAAATAEGSAADEGEALRRELESIWKQQPLQQELQAAQDRYVALLQRLSEEAQERQAQSYRDLLAALADIWSKPELTARTQGALDRFAAALRAVVIQCHATVEKSSSTAIEALSADLAGRR